MSRLLRPLTFLWEFVIGDDWRIAAAVAAAMLATLGLCDNGVGVWWLLPIVVLVMLALSVWTATRTHS